MIWADITADLDLAMARPFDLDRAARLVSESVFDDLLDPGAWRILSAALDRESAAAG